MTNDKIIICCSALLLGMFFHFFIRRFWLATVLAAVLADVFYLELARIRLGYHDKFVGLAFVVILMYTFPIALAAGVPFYWFRRNRRPPPEGHCQKCGYNLTGNASGVCPECGEKTVMSDE